MKIIKIDVDVYSRKVTTYFPDTDDRKNYKQIRDMNTGKLLSEIWDNSTNRVIVNY